MWTQANYTDPEGFDLDLDGVSPNSNACLCAAPSVLPTCVVHPRTAELDACERLHFLLNDPEGFDLGLVRGVISI